MAPRGFREGLNPKEYNYLDVEPLGKRARDREVGRNSAIQHPQGLAERYQKPTNESKIKFRQEKPVQKQEDDALKVSDMESSLSVDTTEVEASFEIAPFKGPDRESLLVYIRKMDEGKMDDSAPCPPLLIDALKKTGVGVSSVNKEDHTVTIFQTLENGKTIHETLSPTEVLNFLKGAVAIHEDEYVLSPHTAEKGFISAHEADTTDPSHEGNDVDVSGRVNPYNLSYATKDVLSKELNTLPPNEVSPLPVGEVHNTKNISDERISSQRMDGSHVQGEGINGFDYEVTPLTGKLLSYVKNISIKNLQINNRWPSDLLAALEAVGAEVLDYEHVKPGAPLKFLLINSEGKAVELKMNAQEGAAFLKSTISPLKEIKAVEKNIEPPSPVSDTLERVINRPKNRPVAPDAVLSNPPTQKVDTIPRNDMPVYRTKGDLIKRLKEIDPQAYTDEKNKVVVRINGKEEHLLLTEVMDFVRNVDEEAHGVPTTPLNRHSLLGKKENGRKSLLERADENLALQDQWATREYDMVTVEATPKTPSDADSDADFLDSVWDDESANVAEALRVGASKNTEESQTPTAVESQDDPFTEESIKSLLSSDKEGNKNVYEWFERDLGITADQLNSVPGFVELPYLKKVSVLESIKDLQRDFVKGEVDKENAIYLAHESARASIFGKMFRPLLEKLTEKDRFVQRGMRIDKKIKRVRIGAPEALLTALVEEVNTPITPINAATENDDGEYDLFGKTHAEQERLRALFRESLALKSEETLTETPSTNVVNEINFGEEDVEFADTVIKKNDAELEPVAPTLAMEKDLHPYEKLVVKEEHHSIIEKRKEIQELGQRFASEFGITAEELTQIEGFDKLTLPQQRMVYENLVQSTYGHVQEVTLSKYSESEAERRREAESTYGKFLGRAWAGVRGAMAKDLNLHKIEKQVVSEFAKGGLVSHKTILEQLVRGVPRVHQDEETGELLVDLVHMEFDRKNRPHEYEAVRKLNDAAHKFAKIPLAWREDTLGVDGGKENEWGITKMFKERFSDSRKRHLAYEESEKTFNDAREILEQTLRESGRDDKEIAQILLGVDSRVNQLQFIQTSPDAVDELAHIADQNVYLETAKSLFSKSGLGYVALGYVGRTMATGLLGWIAAPVVSSGIAATRSWNKTAAELRERDRNARKGTVDSSEEALNIVSGDSLIEKTKKLLINYYTLEQDIIELTAKAKDPALLKRRQGELIKRLSARVDYIYDKQKLNKVNYGTRDQSIGKQVELYELLGEAKAITQNFDTQENEKLNTRLAQYLAYKDESIDAKRRLYRGKELGKQALKAGGFALAGAYIADYFQGARVEREVASLAEAPRAVDSTPVSSPEQVKMPEASQEAPRMAIPETKVLGEYKIMRGDTLTKILKEQMPDIKNIGNPVDKERALANLFKSLTPDELNAIGLRSGNTDSIYANETLKLGKLSEIIKLKGGIDRFLRR